MDSGWFWFIAAAIIGWLWHRDKQNKLKEKESGEE
jgi:hypothetical protein